MVFNCFIIRNFNSKYTHHRVSSPCHSGLWGLKSGILSTQSLVRLYQNHNFKFNNYLQLHSMHKCLAFSWKIAKSSNCFVIIKKHLIKLIYCMNWHAGWKETHVLFCNCNSEKEKWRLTAMDTCCNCTLRFLWCVSFSVAQCRSETFHRICF